MTTWLSTALYDLLLYILLPWITLSLGVGLLLGRVIRRADRQSTANPPAFHSSFHWFNRPTELPQNEVDRRFADLTRDLPETTSDGAS